MPYKIRSELASLVKQLFMDRVGRRTSRKARSRILVARMDFQRSGEKFKSADSKAIFLHVLHDVKEKIRS